MQLRRALLFGGVIVITSASAAHAAFHIEGVNEVTLAWSPASGPVDGYVVHVARNGGAEAFYARVPDTRVQVGGQPGDSIVVRVAAEDAVGNQGPFSPPSEPLVFSEPEPPPPAPGAEPPPGDLDGDGASDLVLRDPHSGETGIYALEEGELVSRGELPSKRPTWGIAAIGDLDGNGAADLVWSRDDPSRLEVWLIDAATLVGGGRLEGPAGDWSTEQAADADGDGLADLWLRDASSGALELWRMDGSEVLGVERLEGHGADWQLASARDFDGDGRSDLLWHSPALGPLELWLMDGAAPLETVAVDDALGGDWTALGAGDFDGDGLPDALLESRGLGRIALRSPFGATPVLELAAPEAAARELLAIGDFDGDGREEILWRDLAAQVLELWAFDAAGVTSATLADPMAAEAPGSAGCPGDLDGDGWIGVTDIEQLFGCFGGRAVGSCESADIDGDGVVAATDYGALIRGLGEACSAP